MMHDQKNIKIYWQNLE